MKGDKYLDMFNQKVISQLKIAYYEIWKQI